MLGPAEIDDMMLEYAEAEAEAHKFGHTRSQQWPPSSWSWGAGLHVTEDPCLFPKHEGFTRQPWPLATGPRGRPVIAS